MRSIGGAFGARRIEGMRWGGARYVFRTLAAALRARLRARAAASPAVPERVRERLRPSRAALLPALDGTLARAERSETAAGQEASGRGAVTGAAVGAHPGEAVHTAPGAARAFAEAEYTAEVLESREPESRQGLAQPRSAAQSGAPAATEPDGRQGLAQPEETEVLPMPCGHAGGPTDRLLLAGGLREESPLGFAAAGETVSWRLAASAAWRDLWPNPYYDYLAWARAMTAGTTEELLWCGTASSSQYLHIYAERTASQLRVTAFTKYLVNGSSQTMTTALATVYMSSGTVNVRQDMEDLNYMWGQMFRLPGVSSVSGRAASVLAFDADYWHEEDW